MGSSLEIIYRNIWPTVAIAQGGYKETLGCGPEGRIFETSSSIKMSRALFLAKKGKMNSPGRKYYRVTAFPHDKSPPNQRKFFALPSVYLY